LPLEPLPRLLDRWRTRNGRRNESPEDPQVVFPKALERHAYSTDHSGLEIGQAAEPVPPLVPERLISNRVDGEIAPGEVLVERCPVFHHRVPTVGRNIFAERGDFVMTPASPHRHRAKPLSHRDGVLKQLLDDLGCRRSRHVVVGVHLAQQRVPDGAADTPRLMTGGVQRLGDFQDIFGDFEAIREMHGRKVRVDGGWDRGSRK